LSGDASQLCSANATCDYSEVSTSTEQAASEVSFPADRMCSSSSTSQTSTDVKRTTSNRPAVHSVSTCVSSVNLVNRASVSDLVNVATSSSVLLSSQTLDNADFTGQTVTSVAASRCVLASDQQRQTEVNVASYSLMAAQTSQPVLEVGGSSLHPVLPNQSLPFKVIF